MEVGVPITGTLLLAIIGTLILAVVGILCYVIKQMGEQIENLNECEKKNYALRHNFDVVTKGIMDHLDREIGHMKVLMESKFEIIIKALETKKR